MKKWAVQDAKNQLSQLIELVQSQGPQTITRHGRPMAVIMGFDEFQKMRPPIKETPLEFFSRLKGLKLDLKRRKDLPRKISL
jgi:antitoxin Phd